MESCRFKVYPLLGQLFGLDSLFPLLFHGYEILTNEQKAVDLDLMSNTEPVSCSRYLQYVPYVTGFVKRAGV
jgi:hypothetical protein